MAESLEQGVKVRICPVCNMHNFGESIMCKRCDFSLGDVDFADSSENGAPQTAGNVRDEPAPSAENDVIKTGKPETRERFFFRELNLRFSLTRSLGKNDESF